LKSPLDAMRDAASLIQQKKGMLPYKAVIVDEAQDMGPQEFNLINSILTGVDPANSLFIAGDAHQRIYGRKVVLSHSGINIRGRSKKLRINYRTTEENRNWAVALLKGLSFDDLDGGVDTQDGYRSLIHGAAPEVHRFPGFEEEIDFIVGRIAPLISEYRNVGSVCIAVRTNKLANQYSEELKKHGLSTCIIKHSEKDSQDKPGVRIATMHRVKGLEFNTMIIASANKGIIPHSKAIMGSDSVTSREGEKAEKALLYVAVTRARKNVLITGYGEISEWLGL
ncbi:MAG: AAA family ATPase, partial [Candidatus Sabulitectum sp.]|nr:AAA family ATPase [Candidatus Sabulitectum sp.]